MKKRPLRILFLEDNEDFAESLADFMQPYGWELVLCRHVREAKRLFETEPFDAVVTDLHVESRSGSLLSSGLDLVDFVRDRLKSKIPLIVTTGLELISEKNVIDHGADLFYYKSTLNPNAFRKEVEELIQRKGVFSQKP